MWQTLKDFNSAQTSADAQFPLHLSTHLKPDSATHFSDLFLVQWFPSLTWVTLLLWTSEKHKKLWQVSLPFMQSSLSIFFTLDTLIKQIHLWNCWLPLTAQSARRILDMFTVFCCRQMQKKESKSKKYNTSDNNQCKTSKKGRKDFNL